MNWVVLHLNKQKIQCQICLTFYLLSAIILVIEMFVLPQNFSILRKNKHSFFTSETADQNSKKANLAAFVDIFLIEERERVDMSNLLRVFLLFSFYTDVVPGILTNMQRSLWSKLLQSKIMIFRSLNC